MNTPDLTEILKIRRQNYGEFSEQSCLAQDLKSLLRDSPGWDYLAKFQKEALEMIAVKISRIILGENCYTDSWQDIAGYAECVLRAMEKHE